MPSVPNVKSLQAGASKMIVSLSIALIIFIVLLIVAGRILNLINKSNCTTDPNIKTAHKWAAWAVGITTLGMIVCIVFLGILIAGMVA